MSFWPRWRARRDDELSEEIRSHMESAIQDRIESGEPPDRAAAAARREFGNVDLVRAVTRDTWGWTWVESWIQDLRHAVRSLRRYPALTAAAVLTLGLGIGANTAVFSMMNAVLLRPLPADDPASLVRVRTVSSDGRLQSRMSYPNYVDLSRASAFAGLIASNVRSVGFRGPDHSERLGAEIVTGNYFPVLGTRPEVGRLLSPEDDRHGAVPVVVISHSFWQLRFDGRSDILNRDIYLNGRAFTLVGVAAREFTGMFAGAAVDFWVPLHAASDWIGADVLTNRDAPGLQLIGRLDERANASAVQVELSTVAERLARSYPKTNAGENFQISPARLLPDRARTLVIGVFAIVMAFVVLVLLAGCANFVNLLLARAASRRRENSVRMALGAGRFRLVRQHVAEGMILAALAGIAALPLGVWAVALFEQLVPKTAVPLRFDFSPDVRVFGFTIAVAVVTGIVLGLVPGFNASRNLVSTLRDESAGAGRSRGSSRLRGVLVVAQVGVSTLLLIGAMLFVRSMLNLRHVGPGFSAENAIAIDIDPNPARMSESETEQFYRALIDRVSATPDVESATIAGRLPLSLATTMVGVHIEGHQAEPGESSMKITYERVGGDYFSTMAIPLIRGREFDERDDSSHDDVAIINRAMAERFWPDQDPLGQSIRLAEESENRELAGQNMSADLLYVIGVARDVKYRSLGDRPEPHMYVPYLQRGNELPNVGRRTLVVRGSAATIPSIREAISSLSQEVDAYSERSLDEHVALSLLPAKLAMTFSAAFGTLAVILAAVGLYSVLSFWVVQRSPELGIRIALGATDRDVWERILAEGGRLIGIGLAAGIAVTLGVGRFLSGALYEVSANDPVSLGATCALLLIVGMAAAVIPARRAMRLDPTRVMRSE